MIYNANIHNYSLKLFLLSAIIGLIYFFMITLQPYQYILVVDGNDNRVKLAIYCWRKDKVSGLNVDPIHARTYKIQKLEQIFSNAFKDKTTDNQTLWLFQRIDKALIANHLSPSETLVFVLFERAPSLKSSHSEAFIKLIEKYSKQIPEGYENLSFYSYDPSLSAVAKYLALNSVRKIDSISNDYSAVDLLIDFDEEYFSQIYSISSPELSKNLSGINPNDIITYQLSTERLNLYRIPNQCFGQSQLFLRIISYFLLFVGKDNIEFACLPDGFDLHEKDFKHLDSDCYNEFPKNFRLSGSGNSSICRGAISDHLKVNLCPEYANKTCFSNSSYKFNVGHVYIANGPYKMLNQLEIWKKFVIKSDNFGMEYNEMNNELCASTFKHDLPRELSQIIDPHWFCWKMSYYYVMLQYFGYAVDEWPKLTMVEPEYGFLKGIAILEANSHIPKNFVSFVIDSGQELLCCTMLLLISLYIFGISIAYIEILKLCRSYGLFNRVFSSRIRLRKIKLKYNTSSESSQSSVSSARNVMNSKRIVDNDPNGKAIEIPSFQGCIPAAPEQLNTMVKKNSPSDDRSLRLKNTKSSKGVKIKKTIKNKG